MVDDFKSDIESKMTVPKIKLTVHKIKLSSEDLAPKLDVDESPDGWENDNSTFFSNLASKLTDAVKSVYSWMFESKQSASTFSQELKQSDELGRRSDHLSLPTPSVTTTNRAVVNAGRGKPRRRRPRKTSRRKQRTAATARCSTALRPAPDVCGMKLGKPERDRGKKKSVAPLMSTQNKTLKPSSNADPHQKRT
jgi:Sec-independent protein translocase protein TatA